MNKLYEDAKTMGGLNMLINCTYCNKEFHKKPSQIKRSKNHFCKKVCHDLWQKGRAYPERRSRIKHNCHQCKKEMEVPNHKYQSYLKGEFKNLFCDKHCLADWQKVNFKGERSPRYNSIEKNCEYCEGEYVTPLSNISSKFYSKDCRIKGRVQNYEVTCDYCDVKFTKKKHKIRNMNFCTRGCSANWNSENNNLQAELTCQTCLKNYKVNRGRKNTSKNCSKECHYIWLKEVYCKNDEVRERLRRQGVESQKSKAFSMTKPERILQEYLTANSIEHIPQHPMYDKFVVDFYLPDKDVVVEVFGDYWHGNPLFYGESDGLKPLSEKQVKQKKKDKARQAYLEKCGHDFVIMWENDIYKNLDEIVKTI